MKAPTLQEIRLFIETNYEIELADEILCVWDHQPPGADASHLTKIVATKSDRSGYVVGIFERMSSGSEHFFFGD